MIFFFIYSRRRRRRRRLRRRRRRPPSCNSADLQRRKTKWEKKIFQKKKSVRTPIDFCSDAFAGVAKLHLCAVERGIRRKRHDRETGHSFAVEWPVRCIRIDSIRLPSNRSNPLPPTLPPPPPRSVTEFWILDAIHFKRINRNITIAVGYKTIHFY